MRITIIIPFVLYLFLFSAIKTTGQDSKTLALEKFKAENYSEALFYIKEALKVNPNDADIYYYLGFFSHYMAYDSRPLQGYNESYSNQIFEYFEKTLELDSSYGNAKYFYGAECSANAFIAMQNYDSESLKYYYKKAYDIGAYPKWLLEFGKNLLNSCDTNAILFTGGNADFDVCMYLQLHQNYRKDITIVPIANIDRPYLVEFFKNGLDTTIRKLNIELSDKQIMRIHPYKWKTNIIKISVPEKVTSQYNTEFKEFEWKLKPDFSSSRIHNKIEDEKKYNRTYLSPQKAVLLHIIEVNKWERPIFFSKAVDVFFMGGLEDYCQDYGIANKLLYFKVDNTEYSLNPKKANEILLNVENFKDYRSILISDIPRISPMIYIYWKSLIRLSEYYSNKDNREKVIEIADFVKRNLKISHKEDWENYYYYKVSEN